MNASRAWPLATIAFGLATLGVFAAFGLLPEVGAIYGPNEASAVVSDFQRATTVDDLVLVFGDPPNPAVIAAMDALNRLDLYAFIPAYALFLITAAMMLAGGAQKSWALAAIAFALAGAAADAIETSAQLRVTTDWANAAAALPIAPWHWAKYGALALNGLAVAALCLFGPQKRRLLGIVALAPLPCVAAAFAGAVEPSVFSAAFGLYWITLLAAAVTQMVRAKDAPA